MYLSVVMMMLLRTGPTEASVKTKIAEQDFPALYWINMKSSSSRGTFMNRYLQSINLTNTRIEGVSPANLPDTQRPSWFHGKRQHHAQEMACLIAHLHAIKEGLKDNHRHFIVAEDDFTFYHIPNITKLWESAPADAMILLIGFTAENGLRARWEQLKSKHLPWTLWERTDPVWGTLMYSISAEGARTLLEKIPCTLEMCRLDRIPPPYLLADVVIYSAVQTYVFGFPFVKHLGVGGQHWRSLIHEEHSLVHRNAMSAVASIQRELQLTDAWTQKLVTQFFI